jgi:branched-chain amino acid transport system substrate-binding protein
VAVVIAGTLMAACGGSSGGSDGIRIGLLVDLSGPFKNFGTDIQAAVDLAVEEINDRGGVGASKLQIDAYDTGGDPQRAVVGIRELVTQDDDRAVIGPVSSGEAEVVFAQAARLHVPIITGTANKEGITELGQGWAFRDTATNTHLYSTVLPIFQRHFDVSSAALIYDEKLAFAVAAAHGAVPAASQKSGIGIANVYTVQTGQTDFSSVVSQLRGQSLNGLYVITASLEAALIAKELERQGIDLPVLGHPAQNSAAFREAGGSSIRSWVVPSVVDPSSTSATFQAFQQHLAALDEDPPVVPEAANYYDIVRMLAQVMTAAKVNGGTPADDAASEVRQGLRTLRDFASVAGGAVSFLPSGDVDRQVYALLISGDRTEVIS